MKTKKDMSKYIDAWKLKQKGLTLEVVGTELHVSKERARQLVSYIELMITYKKPLPKEVSEVLG